MALEDGSMVRIRPWMSELSAAQAIGLADLAERYGAGVIELTNRANLQLRGLSDAEHAALVPELDNLGLTRIDRTPSARVNIALNPIRNVIAEDICLALSQRLSAAQYAALPQKFGFVIDAGETRQMADIAADVRIEATSEGALIVRAEGAEAGRVVPDAQTAVDQALEMADWFIVSGAIGADGRGRMGTYLADHGALPAQFAGAAIPAPQVSQCFDADWIIAEDGGLSPAALRRAASAGAPLRVSAYRALYRATEALASADRPWDNAAQPISAPQT